MQLLIRNMGDHATKSESEIKMDVEALIEHLLEWNQALEYRVIELEQRIIRSERAYDALGRRLEGSERHVEDEGWFD